MHLDEDRNGAIEANPAAANPWTWGAHGTGAIILVNTKNVAVNQQVEARSEIAFRWVNNAADALGAAWTATLTVAPNQRARIFTARAKVALDANELPTLAPIDLKGGAVPALYAGNGNFSLWIEATAFPASQLEADWKVTLTFNFTNTNGQAFQQVVEVRIAPWIMASDLDPTTTVYFVQSAQGEPPPNPSLQHTMTAFVQGAGAQFNRRPAVAGKPFFRDVMKCGYVHGPHHQEIAPLRGLDHLSPARGLGVLPPAGSIRPRLHAVPLLAEGALGVPDQPNTSQDHGGNLLVTPPIANFPHGRIVYGHAIGFECRMHDFFSHQRVQAPFHVDSSWLDVGHVDEFISFLPDAANVAWPWKIVLMSPRLGYAIAWLASVRNGAGAGAIAQLLADAATDAEASRLAGENFAALCHRLANRGGLQAVGGANGWLNAPGVYAPDPAPPGGSAGKMVRYGHDDHWVQSLDAYLGHVGHAAKYDAAQPAIDATRATLLARLGGLGQDRILEIPALLHPTHGNVVTDTADSVNMLVLRGAQTHVLVPAPFGPVVANTYLFREHIQQSVGPLVHTLTFVNEWDVFHAHDGEVHCGTNQIPAPLDDPRRWWTHLEPNNAP
jgi:protein-arginine deiminase